MSPGRPVSATSWASTAAFFGWSARSMLTRFPESCRPMPTQNRIMAAIAKRPLTPPWLLATAAAPKKKITQRAMIAMPSPDRPLAVNSPRLWPG